MRVGYAPYDASLSQPADRRRFPFYAERRGIHFELADPSRDYDLVVVTPRADLGAWSRYRPGRSKLVFDIVDSYLAIPRTNLKAILRGPAKFAAGEARHPFFSYRRALEQMLAAGRRGDLRHPRAGSRDRADLPQRASDPRFPVAARSAG